MIVRGMVGAIVSRRVVGMGASGHVVGYVSRV